MVIRLLGAVKSKVVRKLNQRPFKRVFLNKLLPAFHPAARLVFNGVLDQEEQAISSKVGQSLTTAAGQSQRTQDLSQYLQENTIAARLIVATCFGTAVLTVGLAAIVLMSNPVEIRGIEMNVVVSVQRLMREGLLYTDPQSAPFYIEQYSPLQYYLIATTSYLIGAGPDDPAGIAFAGRVASSIAYLGALILLWLLLSRTLKVGNLLSLVVPLAFIVWAGLFPFTVRPDALASLMIVASLALVLTGIDGCRPVAMTAGVAVGWLSGLAKQDAVVMIFVVVVYISILEARSRFRSGLLIPSISGSLVAVVLMLPFLFIYDPISLKSNIVDGISNGFNVPTGLVKAVVPFLLPGSVIIAAMIFAARLSGISGERRTQLLLLLSFGLLVHGALISLKEGTSTFKYSKFVLIALPTTAYLLHRWLKRDDSTASHTGSAALWSVAILIASTLASSTLSTAIDARRALRRPGFKSAKVVAAQISHLLSGDINARFIVHSVGHGLANYLANQVWAPQLEVAEINYQRGIYDYTNLSEAASKLHLFLVHRGATKPDEVLGLPSTALTEETKFEDWTIYRVLLETREKRE